MSCSLSAFLSLSLLGSGVLHQFINSPGSLKLSFVPLAMHSVFIWPIAFLVPAASSPSILLILTFVDPQSADTPFNSSLISPHLIFLENRVSGVSFYLASRQESPAIIASSVTGVQ